MRVGETSEMVANWNKYRPWIGLFKGAKCDNVPKFNREFARGKSVVVAATPFSPFHIRCHGSDDYLGMMIQNGSSYPMY